jgi:hypothetical protein
MGAVKATLFVGTAILRGCNLVNEMDEGILLKRNVFSLYR